MVLIGALFLFTNFIQLFPLFFFNFLPQDNFNANKINLTSLSRFIENTAKPRFLLAEHIVEISSNYQAPSREIEALLKKSGYQYGEKVAYIGHKNEPKIYSSTQNV